MTMLSLGRVLRTGLSSLRDRAATRLAALRFNPSRKQRLAMVATGFLIVAAIAGMRGNAAFALFYFALAVLSVALIEDRWAQGE